MEEDSQQQLPPLLCTGAAAGAAAEHSGGWRRQGTSQNARTLGLTGRRHVSPFTPGVHPRTTPSGQSITHSVAQVSDLPGQSPSHIRVAFTALKLRSPCPRGREWGRISVVSLPMGRCPPPRSFSDSSHQERHWMYDTTGVKSGQKPQLPFPHTQAQQRCLCLQEKVTTRKEYGWTCSRRS